MNLFLICSVNCVTTFAITDAKCYVPVLTLSSKDNAKML